MAQGTTSSIEHGAGTDKDTCPKIPSAFSVITALGSQGKLEERGGCAASKSDRNFRRRLSAPTYLFL